MIIGIDASNIRAGGGLTHLVQLLAAADPSRHGFERVVVWAEGPTLARLGDRPWLEKRSDGWLNGSLVRRLLWQQSRLSGLARAAGVDVLLAPGGTALCDFRPLVTMSRNLLPFDAKALRRYVWRREIIRLTVLRYIQTWSFRRADGVIFLTAYARQTVLQATGAIRGRTVVIPHGVDGRFLRPPRPRESRGRPQPRCPLRLVYVSIVDFYKHQGEVAQAVAKLRAEGLPLVLDLIGPAYRPALRKLRRVLRRLDPERAFLRYRGAVPYEGLPQEYSRADIGIFASSCENLPNILLEMMASGLPIACSDRGPMPEVLGSAGVYFDPEDPASIAAAIRRLVEEPETAEKLAWAAFERAGNYSWERCARETFSFLSEVAAKTASTCQGQL